MAIVNDHERTLPSSKLQISHPFLHSFQEQIMSEQFPPREDVPSHRRQIVHTCFKCGGIGHKQRDCHKSRESPKDRNEE
jgi:hypothetical protein